MATIGIRGDEPLWQWDVDRFVEVGDFEPGDLVDVSREPACMALTEPVDAEGKAPIPNQLLTKPKGRLLVFLRRGNSVVAARAFEVLAREMPDDYTYAETPTVGYQSLRAEMLQRFADVEERLSSATLIKAVEAPLSLSEDGVLSVDVGAASRGTQITVGDEPPTTGVRPGDSFIRTSDMALLVAQEG